MLLRTRLISLLSVLSFTLSACHDAPSTLPPAPVVLVAEVKSQASPPLGLHGEIRARHEFDLAFRVSGKIKDRLVDVGSPVKAQQALAHLDPTDLTLALASAQAQVQAAQSDLQTAEMDKQRYADLLQRQFVSQAAYDAKANQVQAAAARLKQARSTLTLQSNQQNYTTLSSEHPAIVTALLAEAGQVVAAGQPIFRLALPDGFEISVAVPESRIRDLKTGQLAQAYIPALGDTPLPARLRELSPLADSNSRTFNARFQLLPPFPATLALGMTARIVLQPAASDSPVLRLPARAVIHQGNQAIVWTIDEHQQAQPKTVQTGKLDENGIEILSGLTAGEHVVVTGGERLTQGQTVRPQSQTPPEAQR